jgi:hypothetical protein
MKTKVIIAKTMLKILPEKKEVIDPFRPQEPGETQEEYFQRVPLNKRPPEQNPTKSYLGSDIIVRY